MNKLFKITILFLFFSICLITTAKAADDYLVYGEWTWNDLGIPAANRALTGINGYVDENGLIGPVGAEYVIFVGGPGIWDWEIGHFTAYLYRVEIDCNTYCNVEPDFVNCVKKCPQMHPDHSNPELRPQVRLNPAPRDFTFANSKYLGYFAWQHTDAFYIDDTGIYYGASSTAFMMDVEGMLIYVPSFCIAGGPTPNNWGNGGVFRWDLNFNPIGWVVPDPFLGAGNTQSETLSRNPVTGDWWVGQRDSRKMYKWNGTVWAYQFTYPAHIQGSHHDGAEIVNDSLFVSDMTVDFINQYRLDAAGNVINPAAPDNVFAYSNPNSVEGMGFGPNSHFWISSGGGSNIYEVGGNELQRQVDEVALEGIDDQTIISGEDKALLIPGNNFSVFDLDDYVIGNPPYIWGYDDDGDNELIIDIDSDGIVVITYPDGWIGAEEIEFKASSGSAIDTDSAIFKVDPAPDDPPVVSSTSHSLQYCGAGGTGLANLSWDYNDDDGDIPNRFQINIFDPDGNLMVIERGIPGPLPNPLPSPYNISHGITISRTPGADQIGYNKTYEWQVRVENMSGFPPTSVWSDWSPLESFTVDQYAHPVSDFSWNPAIPIVGIETQFHDETNYFGAPVNTWNWDFGDGNTSTDQNPTNTYSTENDFTVSFQATNIEGNHCSTEEKQLSPKDPFYPIPKWKEIIPF